MRKTETKKYTFFGKQVAKALIDKDMYNVDLAKEIGISVPYLTDILKGVRPAEKRKKQIADFLGLKDVV